jgi:hypothetical protein
MVAQLDESKIMAASSPAPDYSIRDAAIACAKLGFWIVRLKERSKVSDIKGWSIEGKTKDPEVIRRWFEERPFANFGIVCGDGLVVIDIDARKGGHESWLNFVGEHFPNGELGARPLKDLTPGGGLHLYFRVAPGIKVRSRQDFLPGVDVKADGGYVVAPPSIHPNGQRYAWATDFVMFERYSITDPIPFLPEALLLRLVAEQAGAHTKPECEPSLASAAEPLCPDGRQNVACDDSPTRETQTGEPIDVRSSAVDDSIRESRIVHGDRNERRTRDHTRTSRKAPRRPLERSRRKQAQSHGRRSRDASKAKLEPSRAVPLNSAESEELIADVIRRFPVPSVGHRHKRMNRAVGRLVRKGHEDDVIIEVMMRWFEHFDSQGKIESDRTTMEAELEACLRTTRSKPGFTSARSSADHVDAIARLEIPQSILALLSMPVHELEVADAKRRASMVKSARQEPDRNPIGREKRF